MEKSLSTLLAMFVLLAAVLVGCGKNGGNGAGEASPTPAASPSPASGETAPSGDLEPLKDKTKVLIAEDGAASGAGFYIADAKGYFADYNIEVEFTSFSNSDDMLPALAAGQIDVAGGISTASFFNSIAQGIDVRMIADKGHNNKGASYFTFVIDKDLEGTIKDYADLKGKRIAVSAENAVDDYIFSQMLAANGMKRDDVEFVLISDFANMLAAMSNNTIDAALNIEPLIAKGTAEGIHVKFKDATDFAPEAQIAMVLGSPKFVENRDVSLRFMLAYIKALRDYNDAFVKGTGNLDDIITIMTKYTALKDKETWKSVNVTGLNPNGQMFIDDIKSQYEWYKSNGALAGEVDLSKAIDTSLTDEAVKILGEYK
ncbi:ABC transporter substrate-binding protein [Cohnella laeviribosi]|uniref:ABC transporter substrate-binding protein n=1 Tax=Cohnella laeviribosi TaxID=380174 RepID=UPI003D2082C8